MASLRNADDDDDGEVKPNGGKTKGGSGDGPRLQNVVRFADNVLHEEDVCQNSLEFGGRTQALDDIDCTQSDDSQTQVMGYDGDTQLMDDHYLGGETQLVNDPCVGGETQLMDDPCFGGETQLMDDPYDGGETQVLDDPCYGGETQNLDDTNVESENESLSDSYLGGETQVVADSEGEETDRTEVLSDTEELSDDNSTKTTHTRSVHEEKGFMLGTGSLTVQQCSPGSCPRGFASIRAASLRASGLAARRRANMGPDSVSFCIPNNDISSNKSDCANDQECGIMDTPNVEDAEEPHSWGYDKNRVGSLTVRKLFLEDSPPRDSDELGKLSYVDSQEPGDLSQANALDVVDKFLQVNLLEPDQEFDRRHISSGIMNPNSIEISKGTQSLVKTVNRRMVCMESDTFDWDDCREDEGGGGFFSRKNHEIKKEIFNKKIRGDKSLTVPQKLKGSRVKLFKDKEKRPNTDSKIVVLKLNAKGKKSSAVKLKKNLAHEFDEQININCYREPSGTPITETGGVNLKDVGIDTQIAAEAMEALYKGVIQHANGSDQENVNTMEGFEVCNNASEQYSFERRVTRSSSRSLTSLTKEPKSVVFKSSKVKSKRTKSTVKEQRLTINGCEDMERVPSKLTDQRHKGALKRSSVNEVDGSSEKKKIKNKSTDYSNLLNAAKESSMIGHTPPSELENLKLNRPEKSRVKLIAETDGTSVVHIPMCFPKRRRTRQSFSGQALELNILNFPSELVRKDTDIRSSTRLKGAKGGDQSTSVCFYTKRRTRSSGIHATPDKLECSAKKISEVYDKLESSPRDVCKEFNFTVTTPVNCMTPTHAASPVCMGNEYFRQSCKRSRSRSCLVEELNSIVTTVPEPASASKESRKRRDIAHVRVLFSHHLNEDIIKQQKKILFRLGAWESSSISDATHFITDNFVRTRNMLEAIACGKPVVTHLWLESCDQTNCFIDEKSYILRDAKKEKEFGFNMPVSLSRACRHPLLQNRRVLITPNTNPGKDIIASLVKAVHGQAVERIGRSALKDDKFPDDILVLSCDEDYAICVPFLEKGASVYSSELLLNGIVTQKLDYERHRLFEDHIKRTRSSLWLKNDVNKFCPVTSRR